MLGSCRILLYGRHNLIGNIYWAPVSISHHVVGLAFMLVNLLLKNWNTLGSSLLLLLKRETILKRDYWERKRRLFESWDVIWFGLSSRQYNNPPLNSLELYTICSGIYLHMQFVSFPLYFGSSYKIHIVHQYS